LRNLVIWHNRILSSPIGDSSHGEVDVTFALAGAAADDARLFELVSVALMLDRIRSFALLRVEQQSAEVTPGSLPEADRRCDGPAAFDLAAMPRDIVNDVARNATPGGIKLLMPGRKHANDFFKLAMPGRYIVVVALRERADGAADSAELDAWVALIERWHAQHPRLGFVVLNRLLPSQWREWPGYLRFARHQGLTLQDVLCLAQVADGFIGVLDVFGLAAHSSGRPGVYVALDELAPTEAGASPSGQRQIMIVCRDPARIERAVESFLATGTLQQ
jgi:hypothetical protein